MVMIRHCNEDSRIYQNYYLDEMKSELGFPPHTRSGHFERTIERLEMGEISRQVSEPEALILLTEFKRTLPKKLRPKYEERAEELIRSILYDWFTDEYGVDFNSLDELRKRLAEFRDWKLPDYLHEIYDEHAEKLFETLSWWIER